MTALARLAEFGDSDLNSEVAEVARQRLFDTLAAAAVGCSTPEARLLRQLLESASRRGAGNFSPRDRCRLLTGTIRATEVDDIDLMSCTTAGSVVVPAALSALAACDDSEPSGQDRLLSAVIAGYEAMLRLGRAIDGARLIYRGVWPTLAGAAFGAAAATGVALDLPPPTLKNALGIALQHVTVPARTALAVPGYRQWALAGASLAGTEAVSAARAGLSPSPDAIENYRRTLASIAGTVDLDEACLVEDGARPLIGEIDCKTFPTSRQALASVTAFRSLLPLEPDGVSEVRVGVPADYLPMVDQPTSPDSRLGSMLGVQYSMALAAVASPSLFDVRRAALDDSALVKAWMSRIRVEADETMSNAFPAQWGSRVDVKLTDGRVLTATELDPAGSRTNPLDWAGLRSKYRTIASATGIDNAAELDALEAACRAVGALPGDGRPAATVAVELLALTERAGEDAWRI